MPRKHTDSFWESLRKTIEAIAHYAGLIATILAAISFAQGNRFASYIFLIVAYIFLAAFVMRWLARKELQRNLIIAALGVVTFAWLGYNALQDVRNAQGIVVTPARAGETLILLAEFDKRGQRGIDFTTRIYDRLSDEVQRAKLKDVRIETIPASRVRIGDRATARRIGLAHKATFVIWGWYDDISAYPDFVVVPDGSLGQELPRLSDFSVSDADTAFIIREGLPSEVAYLSLFVTGQLLMRQGRLAEARDAFATAEDNARAAKVTEGLGSLYFQQALVLHLLGSDINLVIDAYTRAIEANPNLAPAYYDRSVARLARGDSAADVFADYARAVELDPHLMPFAYFPTRDLPMPLPNADALDKLKSGINAYQVRDYDGAIEQFNAALAAEPSYLPTYYFRARTHHVRGEYSLAIDDYTQFLSTSADYPRLYVAYAYYARALARRSLGMSAQANEDFDAYLKLAPLDDPFRTPAEFYKQSKPSLRGRKYGTLTFILLSPRALPVIFKR